MAFGKFSKTTGLTTWIDGDILAGADLDVVSQVLPPIGAIIAWAKTLTGVPSLPTGWVECNGQVLSDADSPLNGQMIPNLNNSGGGAANRFLRGATTSGGTGGSETHTHAFAATLGDTDRTGADTNHYGFSSATTATNSTSTLPSYYSVIWCMRVK